MLYSRRLTVTRSQSFEQAIPANADNRHGLPCVCSWKESSLGLLTGLHFEDEAVLVVGARSAAEGWHDNHQGQRPHMPSHV